jgi:hypothetical protein
VTFGPSSKEKRTAAQAASVIGMSRPPPKSWIIAIVLLAVVCTVGFIFVTGVIEVTNLDRLVVLNSDFATLSESELKDKISLDHARVLSKDEVDRIRELLPPQDRHLTDDTLGRPFSIELRFDGQKGRKLVLAHDVRKAGSSENEKR